MNLREEALFVLILIMVVTVLFAITHIVERADPECGLSRDRLVCRQLLEMRKAMQKQEHSPPTHE